MNIGKAIKTLRVERGLSQNEFASTCHLTQTSLSQIETGLKRPNPQTMKKICNFLQVPELLVYIMATEETDIPEAKREMYNIVFPNLKKLLLDVFDSPTK